jgi:hypothetical protein
MDIDLLKQEIDALITALGDDTVIARPDAESEVIEKILIILDNTRDHRTSSARDLWDNYLPYAVKHCYRLTKVEPGWEDNLDYFASENTQYCLDLTAEYIETGNIDGSKNALNRVFDASQMIKRDPITRVDALLKALEFSLELNDKKNTIKLYEEAEKVYFKYLINGEAFTGSAWLPKIKKTGQQLARVKEKLNLYYQYAEKVMVSLETETERDLERIIDYLQQNLPGKVTITRRVKEVDVNDPRPTAARHFRVRLKITLNE